MKYTCGCGFMCETWKERQEHLKRCGIPVCVMETPIFAPKKEDPYMDRKDTEALAKKQEFDSKWGAYLDGK